MADLWLQSRVSRVECADMFLWTVGSSFCAEFKPDVLNGGRRLR